MMRRAAAALRRQDWAAVAIEFLLVVIGVLLAFQIDGWGEARRADQLRREDTLRLLHEAEQDVGALTSWNQYYGGTVEKIRIVAQNLDNPNPDPSVRADIDEGLIDSRRYPTPMVPDSVYKELVASGRLGKLGDVRMRDAVSDFASSLAYTVRGIDYVAARSPDDWGGQAVHLAYDPKGDREYAIVADYAKMASDRAFHDIILRQLGSHVFVASNLAESLRSAKVMCAEVARIAGKPCREIAVETVD
jgi:hypothetical protein